MANQTKMELIRASIRNCQAQIAEEIIESIESIGLSNRTSASCKYYTFDGIKGQRLKITIEWQD